MPNDPMLKAMWKSPQTFASVLLTVFLDRFGVEGLQWDPGTITLEVEEEFDVDLPQASLDKLLVAINLVTSDAFYRSLPDFVMFCNVCRVLASFVKLCIVLQSCCKFVEFRQILAEIASFVKLCKIV